MPARVGFLSSTIALAAFTCAACTSAPIDMSAADPLEAEALEQQSALRAGASALVTLVEENGWTVSENPAEAARAFLGRLIGGVRNGEDEPSPVQAYLAAHETPADAALSDIERLSTHTGALAALAIAVAGAEGSLSQAALARDIAAAESALGAARRASVFFEAVRDEAASDEAERLAFDEALSALHEAEAGLARGADALAERRWAARSGLLG